MKKIEPTAEAVDVKTEKTAHAEPDMQTRPESVFTVAQLRPDARVLFGVSQSTFDGATDGIEPDKLFTVSAMRDHINKWLKEVN